MKFLITLSEVPHPELHALLESLPKRKRSSAFRDLAFEAWVIRNTGKINTTSSNISMTPQHMTAKPGNITEIDAGLSDAIADVVADISD